ncbi:DNA polymerase IV [Yimella sp. cx-51]|uniref:DNA polymerase IV n=1 Tax=Yimella sp. cx-51 TaxID=2770551 RepID=UPI00165E0A35|nr:DNA polymerase IV [Yimella sp. cx-51]MBC9957380.1 DNA polymerase IV [Yimella sp. cx-51]QTH39379.1 DNA polymerase IV [Yimella sp. cx-51]
MRSRPSILHLDLDAFFAAVEQRDKPSLRGKPVVVGGTGGRGVVATASYEARKFGARSAMPTSQARRLCPSGTAFLSPRFSAYQASSRVVMGLLRELSPTLEQVSVDEAYVDLADGDVDDFSVPALRSRMERLLAQVAQETGGLTASVGIGSSKQMAKIGSELEKPSGLVIVDAGQEVEVLAPLSVRVLGGVGPVTAERLRTFGVETVAHLQRMSVTDLVSIFGDSHGHALHEMAFARDDRPVVVEREAKSISAEETFAVDIADARVLDRELVRLVERVTGRLAKNGSFARTLTIKVRHGDFSTFTRSESTLHPTGDLATILAGARRLLAAADTAAGLRLLGFGVSGLLPHAQERMLFDDDQPLPQVSEPAVTAHEVDEGWGRHPTSWMPGADVHHAEHGAGWVWGSGLGRVTVRFEGPNTPPGPVRTFATDDPLLEHAEPPQWR